MESTETNTRNGKHQSCRTELREKTSDLKDDFKDVARLAQGAASEIATEMKVKGGKKVADASAAVEEKMQPAAEYIKEKPVRSVLMGLGAGILLGSIFSGRKRR